MSDEEKDSWREYRRLTIETLEYLKEEVQRQHDKLLVMEVKYELKQGNTAIVIHIVTAIIASSLTYLITHKLFP